MNYYNYSNICMKVRDKLQASIKPVKGEGMVVLMETVARWWW